MTGKRIKQGSAMQLLFFMLPKIFFLEGGRYMPMMMQAKVLYSIVLERSRLSVKNNWVNADGEVYFVYPVDKLCAMTGLSKPTVIKAKKELIKYGLLEEVRTGRANRMYLIEPQADQSDFFKLDIQDADNDFGADILLKNADGTTRSKESLLQESTRSKEVLLQDDEVKETRNQESLLQVETLTEQAIDQNSTTFTSSDDQKLNILTTEVKNFYPSNKELSKEEEDNKYNINTHVQNSDDSQEIHEQEIHGSASRDESTQNSKQDKEQLTTTQQAITDTLNKTRLFNQQEVSELVDELTEAQATLEDVTEQLDNMRSIKQLFDPKRYFLNGVKKIIRLRQFKAQSSGNVNQSITINTQALMHNWVNV